MPKGADWKILNGFIGDSKSEYLSVVKKLRDIIRKNFDKYSDSGRLSMDHMSKFNRLNRMLDEMLGSVDALIKYRNKGLNSNLGKSFKASFKRMARKVEKDAKQILGLEVPASAPVVSNNGMTTSTMSNNAAKTKAELRRTVIQQLSSTTQVGDDIVNGATLRDFLGATDNMMDKDYRRLVRVIETEGTRVNGKAQVSVWDTMQEPANYRKRIAVFRANQGVDSVRLSGKKNAVKLYGGRYINLGDLYVKVWVHDAPKIARPGHLAADGQEADENGIFTVNGIQVSAPGEFGIAAEDVNCLCSITIKRRKINK